VGFALPFGEAMAGDDGLSPAERTLLWLLLDGSTDATAARRLEVSRRTVRRTMSSLTGWLGARSSFEAGPRGAAGPTSGPRRMARPRGYRQRARSGVSQPNSSALGPLGRYSRETYPE